MSVIKTKFHRVRQKHLLSIKTGLAILFAVFAFGGGTFDSLPSVEAAATLSLSDTVAPDNVPKFTEENTDKWGNNDELIDNLANDTLVFKLIKVIKYILGGIFMLFFGLYVLSFLNAGDKEEASGKFKNQVIWSFAGFMVIALAKPFSEIFSVLSADKNAGALLTDPASVREAAALVDFSYRSAARMLQYLLGGIALITMGVATFRMLTATGDEETVSSARKTIAWAALGLIIAGGSAIFVDTIFAPRDPWIVAKTCTENTALCEEFGFKDSAEAQRLLDGAEACAGKNIKKCKEFNFNNPAAAQVFLASDELTQHKEILASGQTRARLLVLNYVKYFQTFVGAGAVLMLFLAGFKMVSAGNNEEVITKQRKMIMWIFMGLSTILVSEAFVTIFLPADSGGQILPAGQVSAFAIRNFSAQMGGFTNFLLTFSGGLAVLALIVGALYVSTAVMNPEQAEKGKKILLAAALGLVITISAYALVHTVLSGGVSLGST